MYNNIKQNRLTLIEGYKKRLKNEPELTFKTYCNTQGCDYHSILRWMCRHNIYVSDLKAEAETEVGARQEISSVFVPIVPRSNASEHKLLNGIDIRSPGHYFIYLCKRE